MGPRGSWKAHLEPTITSLSGTTSQSQPKDVPTSNFLLHVRPISLFRVRKEQLQLRKAGHLFDDKMLVTSFHGKRKVRLLASEHDVTLDESVISFDTKSSTAGLFELTRKYMHMHIKETLKLDPSIPSTHLNIFSGLPVFAPSFWLWLVGGVKMSYRGGENGELDWRNASPQYFKVGVGLSNTLSPLLLQVLTAPTRLDDIPTRVLV